MTEQQSFTQELHSVTQKVLFNILCFYGWALKSLYYQQ